MQKKDIVKTSILTTFILIMMVFSWFNHSKPTNVANVYQVYLNNTNLGAILDKEELLDLINNEGQDLKDKYQVANVYPPMGLEIIPCATYNPKIIDVNTIYKKIKAKEEWTIKGVLVTIDNKETKTKTNFNVLNLETLEEAIKNVVSAFVSEENFNNYINDNQPEITETGEIFLNMTFDEEETQMTIKEGNISTGDFIWTNARDLTEFILFGEKKEVQEWTVQKGDTIESIAYDNKLSVEEFLIANPRIKNENTLLAVNQKVNIALINPLLTFVYEKYVVGDEEIKYETETKYDLTKPASYKEVTQKGENGIRRISKTLQYINGEINSQAFINKENTRVLQEPIKEIIVKGRKPSGGGGSYVDTNTKWAWPTNTPYVITSGYGYRGGGFHRAIDISGTGWGSPIYAALDGVVAMSGWEVLKGGGYSIVIDHQNGYWTVYGHLASIIVKNGQKVFRGQKIATMGNTGNVSPKPTAARPTAGTHLHFEVHQGTTYFGSKDFDPRKLYK